MKTLYIGYDENFSNYGGGVIRNRNIKFAKKLYKNLDFYFFKPYKSTKAFYLNALFGCCCGVTIPRILHIKRIIKKNKIDHIFLDGSGLTSFPLFICKKISTTVFFHNVEYNYNRDAVKSKKGLKKILWSFFNIFFYVNEKYICKYAENIITLNKRDSDELDYLYKRKADIIFPTTFVDSFNSQYEYDFSKHYLLFVGIDFFGNTDGLFWFIENCMQSIDTKLIVVGKGMDKYKNKYQDEKIEFYGFVENLEEFYYNADAVVLPIISGSGMKTKTCEALMYGKTIFGTKEAFEGYSGIENTECIQCDNKEEFIQKINEYIENKENIKKFSKLSRELFLTNYEESFQMERVFSLLKN